MDKPKMDALDLYCDNDTCKESNGGALRMVCLKSRTTNAFSGSEAATYQCTRCSRKRIAEWKANGFTGNGELSLRDARRGE